MTNVLETTNVLECEQPGVVSRETLEALWDLLNAREVAILESIAAGEYVPLDQFCRLAWHVVEPGVEYCHNWHIDAICEHLEAAAKLEIRNLIVNIPPRHMKSRAVCVFFPAWVWTWFPAARFLFASYAEKRSIQDAVDCRAILRSSWYRMLWGHRFRLSGDQNVKSTYQNTRRGHRISTGIGGGALGEGGDFLVIDDPHKTDGVESTTIREHTLSWYDKTFSTRGNDPATVVRIIIMQRLHTHDLVGHLDELEEQGGERWERLILPAEYEPTDRVTSIGFRDPRTQVGELIWSGRFGREFVDRLKITLGPYGVAGQLQQRPSPLEGGMFKRAWWRFWQRPGDAFPPVAVPMADGEIVLCPVVTIPDRWTVVAQSWDMAFKDKAASSMVVGQVWGRSGADRYLLDQIRERMDIVATMAALEKLSEKHPEARGKWIEDKANGPAIMRLMARRISGMNPYTPKGDKVSRATAAVPEVSAGNVYLPHPRIYPWVTQWIDRFAQFPATDEDDEIDAFSQIMDVWSAAGWTRGAA